MHPVNPLKSKIVSGRKVCGTHTALASPVLAEILGYAGFDFVWVDLEHAAVNPESLTGMLGGLRLGGTPAIVRVGVDDDPMLKRVLEMGPAGVVFPMIHTAAAARRVVEATLYPPRGTRGCGPQRAVRYGFDDFAGYLERDVEALCRFVQIESVEAVSNIEAILATPYLDGVFIGPFDLSASRGRPGDVLSKDNLAPIRRVAAAAAQAGKIAGISVGSTDPGELRLWDSLGIRMIASGNDYGYVRDGALANLANLRRIQEEAR